MTHMMATAMISVRMRRPSSGMTGRPTLIIRDAVAVRVTSGMKAATMLTRVWNRFVRSSMRRFSTWIFSPRTPSAMPTNTARSMTCMMFAFWMGATMSFGMSPMSVSRPSWTVLAVACPFARVMTASGSFLGRNRYAEPKPTRMASAVVVM